METARPSLPLAEHLRALAVVVAALPATVLGLLGAAMAYWFDGRVGRIMVAIAIALFTLMWLGFKKDALGGALLLAMASLALLAAGFPDPTGLTHFGSSGWVVVSAIPF